MMKLPMNSKLTTSLHWFLGILFLWAAVSKIANPVKFLGDILAYDMPLPEVLMRGGAIVLPWLELLIGLALVASVWKEAALLMTVAMYAVFIVATGQAWVRGLDISCGCFDLEMFGMDSAHPFIVFIESVSFATFRNIALTLIATYLLIVSIADNTDKAG